MKLILSLLCSFMIVQGISQTIIVSEIQKEQSAIENDLKPPISVKGRAVTSVKLTDKMKELNVPGISVAVVREGKLYWAKGYGLANTKTGQKVDNETLFQAGSISKPLAALAALQLVDKGFVDLDEPINTYLNGWKVPESKFEEKQKLTLRHLLTHTGGTTVHGFPGYSDKDEFPTIETVLKGNGNTGAIFIDTEPGTSWRYSGGGYTIMEKMVEDVSGLSLEKYMAEHVFPKLGMTNSSYAQPLPDSKRGNVSLAYNRKGKIIDGSFHHYPEQAAAGLWTTPSDLAKYIIEIQDIFSGKEGGVISPAIAKEMLTKHKGNWGLGPSLRGEDENLIFGHGGKNAGFTNNMLAHVYQGNGSKYEMGISDLKIIEVIEIPEKDLQRFVGTYQMSDNKRFKATVKIKNGKVVIKTGSDHVLEAVGPLTFTDIKDPEILIFQEDENRMITGIKVAGPGIILEKIK